MKAFALIDLLIVIAMIFILAGIFLGCSSPNHNGVWVGWTYYNVVEIDGHQYYQNSRVLTHSASCKFCKPESK